VQITKSSGGSSGRSQWDIAAELVARKKWPVPVEHAPRETFEAHYHATDEELYLLRGEMTFFESGHGDREVAVHAGEAATIPQGLVHRVVIGPTGAAYVMGLSDAYLPEGFSLTLPAHEETGSVDGVAELVELNYAFGGAEDVADADLFRAHLADEFVFVPAVDAATMSKLQFIEGLGQRKKRDRRSKDLRLRRHGDAILASLTVRTGDGAVYLNSRLFERRNGTWLCVRWANAATGVREGGSA
jgi:hypothetical protein